MNKVCVRALKYFYRLKIALLTGNNCKNGNLRQLTSILAEVNAPSTFRKLMVPKNMHTG